MTYTVSFENNNTITVSADSLAEAKLIAYLSHNYEAIGMCVKGENGDFSMTVCRKVWDELLDEQFKGFTVADVLAHLILGEYVWVNFPKETYFDYYEECEVTSICKEGLAYLKEHDRLGNYMEEIGFRW